MDKETLITIIREEIENVLQERSMTDPEIKNREDIVLNLKKKAKDLKKDMEKIGRLLCIRSQHQPQWAKRPMIGIKYNATC